MSPHLTAVLSKKRIERINRVVQNHSNNSNIDEEYKEITQEGLFMGTLRKTFFPNFKKAKDDASINYFKEQIGQKTEVSLNSKEVADNIFNLLNKLLETFKNRISNKHKSLHLGIQQKSTENDLLNPLNERPTIEPTRLEELKEAQRLLSSFMFVLEKDKSVRLYSVLYEIFDYVNNIIIECDKKSEESADVTENTNLVDASSLEKIMGQFRSYDFKRGPKDDIKYLQLQLDVHSSSTLIQLAGFLVGVRVLQVLLYSNLVNAEVALKLAEIDAFLLQIEAAINNHKWYQKRDMSILVAAGTMTSGGVLGSFTPAAFIFLPCVIAGGSIASMIAFRHIIPMLCRLKKRNSSTV